MDVLDYILRECVEVKKSYGKIENMLLTALVRIVAQATALGCILPGSSRRLKNGHINK